MLVIDTSKPIGLPSDYGRKDWHHNEFGQVDYPIYINSNNPHVNTGSLENFNIESQRYRENCTDEALDNLEYGRQKRSAIVEAFNEWDTWIKEWN